MHNFVVVDLSSPAASARVTAVAESDRGAREEQEESVGSDDEGALAPRRFFKEWPHGPVREPADFAQVYAANEVKRKNWLESLSVLQDLVLDYRAYAGQHGRDDIQSRTGLSANVLSSISSGKRSPDFDTYRILRKFLPGRVREDLDDASDVEWIRRDAVQNYIWNLEQTQRRMKREVERRLVDELKQHGITYRPKVD